jgi:hypothetical protein
LIFSKLGGVAAVLDGRFKMVMEIKTREPLQLFDLENYPKELQNIAKDSSFETTRKELLERMEIHLSTQMDEEKFRVFERVLSITVGAIIRKLLP